MSYSFFGLEITLETRHPRQWRDKVFLTRKTTKLLWAHYFTSVCLDFATQWRMSPNWPGFRYFRVRLYGRWMWWACFLEQRGDTLDFQQESRLKRSGWIWQRNSLSPSSSTGPSTILSLSSFGIALSVLSTPTALLCGVLSYEDSCCPLCGYKGCLIEALCWMCSTNIEASACLQSQYPGKLRHKIASSSPRWAT